MSKLSASRERALKNARRVKTKKKKKKKKTIEAKQIARLRIIEKEVEQSKKDRAERQQIIENAIEKSKENLLDIDELDIISTIRNKIVKSLEKLSTNEIIEKMTNCKMIKFFVIYFDENVAYLISSSMMSTIIKSNKHFVLIFFVANKMIKSDIESYSKLYIRFIDFDIDRICQTSIAIRDRNKYWLVIFDKNENSRVNRSNIDLAIVTNVNDTSYDMIYKQKYFLQNQNDRDQIITHAVKYESIVVNEIVYDLTIFDQVFAHQNSHLFSKTKFVTTHRLIILKTLKLQEILTKKKRIMIENFSLVELSLQIERQVRKRKIDEQLSTSLFKRLFVRQVILFKDSKFALVIKIIIVKVVIMKALSRKSSTIQSLDIIFSSQLKFVWTQIQKTIEIQKIIDSKTRSQRARHINILKKNDVEIVDKKINDENDEMTRTQKSTAQIIINQMSRKQFFVERYRDSFDYAFSFAFFFEKKFTVVVIMMKRIAFDDVIELVKICDRRTSIQYDVDDEMTIRLQTIVDETNEAVAQINFAIMIVVLKDISNFAKKSTKIIDQIQKTKKRCRTNIAHYIWLIKIYEIATKIIYKQRDSIVYNALSVVDDWSTKLIEFDNKIAQDSYDL